MDDQYYLIKKNTLDDISESIRKKFGIHDSLTTDNMLDYLNSPTFEKRNVVRKDLHRKTEWTRPEEWPDLDSLNLDFSGDTDFIYMTYDVRFKAVAIAWYLASYDTKPLTLDIGHIENGKYVVDETFSIRHNSNFTKWLDDYSETSDYIVVRITGLISYAYMLQVTSPEGRRQSYRQQPIVERYSCLPHAKYISSGSASVWTSSLLQHEVIANGDGHELLSLASAWAYSYELEVLDISGLKTQNVTDMNGTFRQCYRLSGIDVSNFDTGKVRNMSYMFDSFYGSIVGLENFDTGEVSDFSYMFIGSSPESMSKVEDFDMSSATNINYMFSNCYCLQKLKPKWTFTRPVTAVALFNECHSLHEIDFSNVTCQWISSFDSMFWNCYSLTRIKFNNSERNEIASSVGSMFGGCHALPNIDVSWLKVTNLCTKINTMFSNCWSLTRLDIPTDWDFSGLSNAANMATGVFSGCYSLKTITGIRDWKFYHSGALTSTFSQCFSLESVDVTNWKVDTVNSLSSTFYQCFSLKHIDVSNWRPNNSTSIGSLFDDCRSLIDCGDLSNILTESVTSITNTFRNCCSLQDIASIENWDTSNVLYMNGTFNHFRGGSSLPISNWDVSNVQQITTCFNGVFRDLHSLDLSKWDLSSVTTAPGIIIGSSMLYDYKPFKNLKLSHQYTCYCMSYDSAIAVLENLPKLTSTQTLKIGADTLARLSTNDRKIATNKGWTLAA